MSKVEVLCPNGHRISVKTTPNTKILQILEEACTKKGFLPSSDFELRWGKKLLDVTLVMRYAGLPNLAKLELVKASQGRHEHDEAGVVIALQLENGERLQQQFVPSTTLWGVFRHWEEKDAKYKLTRAVGSNLHPVCVYMQEEVIGANALQHTTLKTLGLTSGRAVLRLLYRPVDEETLSNIQCKIDKEKSRLARLESLTEKQFETDASHQGEERIQPMEVDESVATVSSSSGARPKDKVTPLWDMDMAGAQPEQHPTLSPQQESVARHLAQNILPEIFPNQDPQQMEYLREQRRQQAAQKQWLLNQMQRQQQLQSSDFSNFKFPEETKGQDLYENELSDVDKKEFLPCDRETIIYDSTETKAEPIENAEHELPDNFFDITEEDVRKMYSDLQRQISEEAEGHLMTQSMKQSQLKNRLQCYKCAVVRFHFPDKLVVQAVFRPNETVHSLKKFVKSQLAGQQNFYLFTAPPKCILKDDAVSLIHAHIVPMSVVYVGFEKETGSYLSADVLQMITSQGDADQNVAKHMQATQPTEAEGTSDQVKRPNSSRSTDQSGSGKKKMPKWFKIGKK